MRPRPLTQIGTGGAISQVKCDSVDNRAPKSISLTRPQAKPGADATKPAATIRAPILGTPWERYEAVYDILDFDGRVTVAVRDRRVVHIREFSGSGAERAVQHHLQLRHKNITDVVEAFNAQESHYIVMEEMKNCLYHLVRCPKYPSDEQLRSILVQLLDGLAFLHRRKLGYGSLDCKNILVHADGFVKLANQEKLQVLTPEIEAKDASAIGIVALNLMQKDSGPGVRDGKRWAAFLGFVADAATVRSVAELRQDPLFAGMPHDHEQSLVALALASEVASQKFYKIPARSNSAH